MSGTLLSDIRNLWTQLDTDGSGDLSIAEFSSVISSMASQQWVEAFDEQSATTYYYNKHTRETRWEKDDTDSQILAFLEEQNLLSSNEIEANPVCGVLDKEQHTTVI